MFPSFPTIPESQGTELHPLFWARLPLHPSPERDLDCVPSHVALHAVHSDHGPHPPEMRKGKKT